MNTGSFFYNVLEVNAVQSYAFAKIAPAHDLSRAFDIVPQKAWEIKYRGMVTIFHNANAVEEYVFEKIGAIVFRNHIQIGGVEIPID